MASTVVSESQAIKDMNIALARLKQRINERKGVITTSDQQSPISNRDILALLTFLEDQGKGRLAQKFKDWLISGKVPPALLDMASRFGEFAQELRLGPVKAPEMLSQTMMGLAYQLEQYYTSSLQGEEVDELTELLVNIFGVVGQLHESHMKNR